MPDYKETTEMFQILDENGEVDKARLSKLNITNDLLQTMYEWLLKGRMLDEKLLKLQRQGRIASHGPFSGQEAAQAGSALAIEKTDWIVPSYREIVALLIHGLEIEELLSGGKSSANIFPNQTIVAGQIPQSVGFAWGSKLKGENNTTICYFGDGATSQGDFHEGMNFASVFKVPIVFFCQNNQWAISVPFEKQTASETIAQKAIAYGMKGVRVDGNDVLACYQVTKEAIERIRNGDGPTLIEAVTYRQGAHTTADDPTKYRKKEDVEIWINQKDPLVRFEHFLKQSELLSNEKKETLTVKFEKEIDEAVAAFDTHSPMAAYEIFDYVYDHPHDALLQQKEELKNRMATNREGI